MTKTRLCEWTTYNCSSMFFAWVTRNKYHKIFYCSNNWCDYLWKEALSGFSIWPWLSFSVEGMGRPTVLLSSFGGQPLFLQHKTSQKPYHAFCWTKTLKLTWWVSLFIQECSYSFNEENAIPPGTSSLKIHSGLPPIVLLYRVVSSHPDRGSALTPSIVPPADAPWEPAIGMEGNVCL